MFRKKTRPTLPNIQRRFGVTLANPSEWTMLISCDIEDLDLISGWIVLIHSDSETQHWVRVDSRYNFHDVRTHIESIEPLAVPSIFIQEQS